MPEAVLNTLSVSFMNKGLRLKLPQRVGVIQLDEGLGCGILRFASLSKQQRAEDMDASAVFLNIFCEPGGRSCPYCE